MDFGISNVIVITVIVYLIGMAAKAVEKIPDKLIPVICGVAGGILGAVGMMVIPDYPAADIISAVAVGIVSGLAATGVNQVGKQFAKE